MRVKRARFISEELLVNEWHESQISQTYKHLTTVVQYHDNPLQWNIPAQPLLISDHLTKILIGSTSAKLLLVKPLKGGCLWEVPLYWKLLEIMHIKPGRSEFLETFAH